MKDRNNLKATIKAFKRKTKPNKLKDEVETDDDSSLESLGELVDDNLQIPSEGKPEKDAFPLSKDKETKLHLDIDYFLVNYHLP